ncbi:MAG: thioredoxin family protein [Bacteroidales bacterium]|nr:thioredoxin family protein [Bacteroidales bacterium]MBN2819324.1 thioredoxin family protein [Bacteroidales bacterium]
MKKLIRQISLLIILLSVSFVVKADVDNPVKWQTSIQKLGDFEYEIIFSAKIDAGWHLYGLNIPEGGPIATSFNYSDSSVFKQIKVPVSSKNPEIKFDETFNMELELYNNSVVFKQKLILKDKTATISGYIEFMSCDDSRCLPPSEIEFEFTTDAKPAQATSKLPEKKKELPVIQVNTIETNTSVISDEITEDTVEQTKEVESTQESAIAEEPVKQNQEPEKTLWQIFFEALSKGLLAIFTPCVFPIIPLTVAFFMRDNSTAKRVFQAVFFGLSIVFIYALVGLAAGIFQIDLTELTKHWLANIIIVAVLVIFAVSFFGVFELVLPSKLSNKLDSEVDKGGLLAPFFLALVTAIVSFSCVGPIAGVAIGAAMTGEIISPVIAMIGFSAAFAFPFVLLGIFPGMLKKMPKSGGWLNGVKVVFAFLMIIASYIFLGNTQWAIFNRDVILSLNIVTFILLGLYLLGKIRFSHDSDIPFLSVPRLFLAIASFSVAVYLVPGLFGSPLKAFTPFLPPTETSEFKPAAGNSESEFDVGTAEYNLCEESPKYADKLHLPYDLKGYFDWDEALACAKKINKPVLVDFVGHSCKNCKKMYAEVWSDDKVQKILSEDFVLLALYTDDRTKLPENEWVYSEIDGRIKKTLGKKNLDLQISKYNSNALPMYVIVDANGNILTNSTRYYTYSNDVDAFIHFLKEGTMNYK